jgi:hypothetical protein
MGIMGLWPETSPWNLASPKARTFPQLVTSQYPRPSAAAALA